MHLLEAFALEQISAMPGLHAGLDAGFAFARIAANEIAARECGVFTYALSNRNMKIAGAPCHFPALAGSGAEKSPEYPKTPKSRVAMSGKTSPVALHSGIRVFN